MKDRIDIPKEKLDMVIKKAVKRGKKDMLRKKRNSFLKVAACASLVFMGSMVASVNYIPAFAQALKEIPGVAGLVRVIEFDKNQGTGGKIADGQELEGIAWERDGDKESIILSLDVGEGAAEIPGVFEVVHEQYPGRLVITLNGIRGGIPVDEFKVPKGSNLLGDVYRLITLDDSAQRIVISFTEPVEFTVAELNDPAGIQISFTQASNTELPTVFSLRTGSEVASENIAVIEERLKWEFDIDARVIRDSQGTQFVELGLFQTHELAQEKKAELEELLDTELFIEERTQSQVPEAK